MLGNRFGTGGSSGHEYLRVTAARSRIFSDFFNLAGYYIPKVMLPTLPHELHVQLGFSLQHSLSNSSSPRARVDSLSSGTSHMRVAAAAFSLPATQALWAAQALWVARALSLRIFRKIEMTLDINASLMLSSIGFNPAFMANQVLIAAWCYRCSNCSAELPGTTTCSTRQLL